MRKAAPMQKNSVTAQKAPVTFQRAYPGAASEVRQVRADLAAVAEGCPAAGELILLASELATNAIMHSRSGEPGAAFTVRAEFRHGDHAWLEVEDQGGDWTARDDDDQDDERGRGLAIVAAIAGNGNWGIKNGDTRCTVWARLAWHQDQDA
jgi:anti-sigma regulatory factor (Ser/Thr protein kinase)